MRNILFFFILTTLGSCATWPDDRMIQEGNCTALCQKHFHPRSSGIRNSLNSCICRAPLKPGEAPRETEGTLEWFRRGERKIP